MTAIEQLVTQSRDPARAHEETSIGEAMENKIVPPESDHASPNESAPGFS